MVRLAFTVSLCNKAHAQRNSQSAVSCILGLAAAADWLFGTTQAVLHCNTA